MNKLEIVTAIAEKTELTKKQAEAALVAFQEVVRETLIAGEKVSLTGFMSFETVDVAERECRNPKDGTTVVVPKHRKVKVKIGKTLKDEVK